MDGPGQVEASQSVTEKLVREHGYRAAQ